MSLYISFEGAAELQHLLYIFTKLIDWLLLMQTDIFGLFFPEKIF
jgi:hypothetical protein